MSQAGDGLDFSLVRGGPFFRILRALRLVPASGFGVRRRIISFVALTWLPVAVGALAIGRFFPSSGGESLLQHFGVQVRCLVALPLLLTAEALADRLLPALLRYFVESDLVSSAQQPGFQEALRAAERLRDSRWGELSIVALVIGVTFAALSAPLLAHEVAWAVAERAGSEQLAFAGIWYLVVSRPVFLLFALRWLWRIAVLYVLFRGIARLDLQLVAIHPDRAAGLGFLDLLPRLTAPVALAFSAVIAGQLAHEVLYHDVRVSTLQPLAVAWLAIGLAVFLSPLLPFTLKLGRMRRMERLRYGDLLGEHGRMFATRWFGRGRGDQGLLGVQDISAATDALALYQAVETLRPFPFGVRGVVPLAAAILLPLVPVFAIEIPLKDLVLRIVKTLL